MSCGMELSYVKNGKRQDNAINQNAKDIPPYENVGLSQSEDKKAIVIPIMIM